MNIEYDYRQDTKCGDPDADSHKLYDVQEILWSKALTDEKELNLKKGGTSSRLLLKSDITDNLSSDRMSPHFVGKYNNRFKGWLTKIEEESFQRKVRTIGGHIVFSAHRSNGFTINQSRGVNKKICDRFDLTLECIKRFYSKEKSPLFDTLERYSGFLNLFINFRGYVDYFLLQDFVDNNYNVIFTIPFDNFKRTALPLNKEEYNQYKDIYQNKLIKEI